MRIEIVQRGRVLKQYSHEGRTFIEAPPTGDYTIRLTNDSPRRRKAVVSVDGINVIDGETAGKREDGKWGPGYVLRAWETLNIPGWRRDDNKVARFTFEAQDQSYSAQVGKGTANTGVIGIAVWDEKEQPRPEPVIIREEHHHHHYPTPWRVDPWPTTPIPAPHTPFWWGTTYSSTSVNTSNERLMETLSREIDDTPIQAVPAAGAACAAMPEADTLSAKGATTRGLTSQPRMRRQSATTNDNVNLGTGYGSETVMYTQTIEFQTATVEPVIIVQVQYATRTKLIAWGVPVQETPPSPSAFPSVAAGVPAPPGWRG